MGNLLNKNKTGRNADSQKIEDNRRHVFILYNGSNPTHTKNARAFRDALQGGSGGKNFNIEFKDVNKPEFDCVSWLKKIETVLVLCVNENSAGSLQKIIDNEEIKAIEPDAMPRVLSVSFGKTPPRRIMGEILDRPYYLDQKDFCFEFQDENNLNAHDFNTSPTMRELKTSIMSA